MKQLLILCMALFAAACSDQMEITPSGNPVTQSRRVGNFSEIEVSNGIHLTISQAANDAIRIEADDNIIQYVEVYTQGEKLFVEIKDGIDIQSTGIKKTLNVSLSTSTLHALAASGGSKVGFATAFRSDNLEIVASGGTNITGQLHIGRLSCSLSGGSTMRSGGDCSKLHIEASGGSEYRLYDLITEEAALDLNGGSIAELHTTKTLRVTNASGGSRIYYKGDAQVPELNLSGGSTILKQ